MIDLERWNEIKAIVQEALDRPAEERAAYLTEVCGEDSQLRKEVEALLAVSETRADFFDSFQVLPPGFERAQITADTMIGPYRIIRPLGEGGMGTVYLAQDSRVDRLVALKTVPRRSGRILVQEQQLLARLQHPAIAALYDSGTTPDGFGYFVMEYVEGEPITAYCERRQLGLQERLALFLSVCDAVSFAHRQLVVHRDIKPSNILVTADGQPKLLDFGIAKSLPAESPDLTPTRPEDRPLTVAFASPEQVDGQHTTTATDIYSLGVLLCVLLTGKLPYPVKSHRDLPWAIRNLEPTKPSQLLGQAPSLSDDGQSRSAREADRRTIISTRLLRGDLDAIILRALRKEPDKRYQSVRDFEEDVRRFLTNRPVTARRGTSSYRLMKFVRRHRIGAALFLIAFLAGIAGTALFIAQYRETTRQRDQAQDVARVLNEIFTLENPWKTSGEQITAREMLDRASGKLSTLSLEPVRKATALYSLGTLYAELGIYPKAKDLLSDSLNLRVQHLGTMHNDTISTQNALGGALYYLAEYKEAERLLGEAERTLRANPKVHQDLLVSVLTNLARVYFEEGKPADAERLEREGLQILDAAGRGDSKEAAEIHSHLGLTLTRLDRLPEAEAHHRRSLQIRTTLFGSDHPTTGNAHHNLALNLTSQRRYPEAEEHYRKALAIARKSLPPEHPIIPAILDSLASACAHQKRFAEAETLLREALTIKRQILPKNHPSIPLSMVNLASIIADSDPARLPEAEPLYLEAIADFRRLAGSSSRQVGMTLYTYGRALFRHGESRRAWPIIEEAYRTIAAVDGPNHLETALVERTHAQVLLSLNEVQTAEPLLVDSVRIFRDHQPQDPHELASTLTLLGRCRLRLSDLEGAKHVLQEAHTLFSANNDLSSPEGKALLAELDALSEASARPGKTEKLQ